MESRDGTRPKTRVRKGNAKTIKPSLSVKKAEFIGGYQLNIYFSDGTQRLIDFTNAFNQLAGYYAQYRQPERFQRFTIENGNMVWGKDWDVIYPDLYQGRLGRARSECIHNQIDCPS